MNLNRIAIRLRNLMLKKRRRFIQFDKLNPRLVDHDRYSPTWVHKRLAREQQPLLSFDVDNSKIWMETAKAKLWDLVGEIDPPEVIEPVKVWSAEDQSGSYEKILLEGEFGSIIPLYRCIPKKRRKSNAWIICLQGHNSGMHNSIGVDSETECHKREIPGDREFVRWCFANGFAAVCLEQRCFGERREQMQIRRASHPCHDAAMTALLFGRTLMGERLSDVRLGAKFINECCDRDYGEKMIGVMGNSLGGTIAIYANTLIEEIKFAIAGSCVSSIDESIVDIYHCADLYIPQLRKFFEFGEITGLAAPKPLIVVQGQNDPIFPIKGMQIAVNRVSQIYSQFNAESHFIVKVGNGGHRFYQDLATEAVLELKERI